MRILAFDPVISGSVSVGLTVTTLLHLFFVWFFLPAVQTSPLATALDSPKMISQGRRSNGRVTEYEAHFNPVLILLRPHALQPCWYQADIKNSALPSTNLPEKSPQVF